MNDRQRFSVTLTTPQGDVHDITRRMLKASLARVTERGEEDLGQLTHNDMTLQLDNADGWVSQQFASVTAADIYEIVIEQERAGGSYERIFAGILDLPYSVTFNAKQKSASIKVYSYSKLLEKYSAAGTVRSFTGRTLTASSGTATATMNDTTGLVAGDSITVTTAGGASETKVVAGVSSSTAITVTANWSNSFTAAAVTLDTPYPRNETVEEVASQLFGIAGITEVQIVTGGNLSNTPFPNAMTTTGLPGTTPASVLESGGDIKVYTNSKRYGATDLQTAFADQGADTVKMDWRPYDAGDTAPGTLRAASGSDDGTRATDPATGDYYALTAGATTLTLQKNGVTIATVYTKSSIDQWAYYGLDWCPQRSEIWVGHGVHQYVTPADPVYTTTTHYLTRYTSAGAVAGTLPGGLPRSVRRRGYMAVLTYDVTVDIDPTLVDSGVALYDVSSGASLVRTLPPTSGAVIWTLRALDSSIMCCISKPSGVGTYIAVWRDTDATLLAEHQISTTQTTANIATVYNEGGTVTPSYVAYGGGTWVAVSTAFSGVVPYADFEGLTVGGALKELALFAASYVFVDAQKTGYIASRSATTVQGSEVLDIGGRVLEWSESPVWEQYRSRVVLTAKTEAGADLEAAVGSPTSGDAWELDLQLPTTQGYLSALASDYLAWFGSIRRGAECTILRPSEFPHFLSRILVGDTTWRVLVAEADRLNRSVTLQLAEEV